MKKVPQKLSLTLLYIRELSGLNLNLSRKIMTPEDHKSEVENMKNKVLATSLAKVFNCSTELRSLVDHAFYRATRSNNKSIQGKLSQASLKLNELLEILEDSEIQSFVGPINEEDIRRIRGN